MIRIVRQLKLLTALALLLAGVVQPLAAAQGLSCARTDAEAASKATPAQQQVFAVETADAASGSTLLDSTSPTQEAPSSQSEAISGQTSACGAGAALLSEHQPPAPPEAAHRLLYGGDLVPTFLLLSSLFRPPRLI